MNTIRYNKHPLGAPDPSVSSNEQGRQSSCRGALLVRLDHATMNCVRMGCQGARGSKLETDLFVVGVLGVGLINFVLETFGTFDFLRGGGRYIHLQ